MFPSIAVTCTALLSHLLLSVLPSFSFLSLCAQLEHTIHRFFHFLVWHQPLVLLVSTYQVTKLLSSLCFGCHGCVFTPIPGIPGIGWRLQIVA